MSEEFNNFDSFLVGKGSYDELNSRPVDRSFDPGQFSGIMTLQDLRVKPVAKSYDMENDLFEFVEVNVQKVTNREAITDIFFVYKKKIFDIFGFIEKKSQSMGDIPVTQRELVVTGNDESTINYICYCIKDVNTISAIAKLSAFMDMGINNVKFVSLDGCPICSAFNGMNLSCIDVYNLLCSGESITHPMCCCDFEPVIFRANNDMTIDLKAEGKTIYNVPVEYVEKMKAIAEFLDVSTVRFENIIGYYFNKMDNESFPDIDSVIAIKDEDELIVSNVHLSVLSPIDYVNFYIMDSRSVKKIDVSTVVENDNNVFFMRGKKVILHDGKYWDSKTGEVVK